MIAIFETKQTLQDVYMQIIKNIIVLKRNQRVLNFFFFNLTYYKRLVVEIIINDDIDIVIDVLMQY